MRMRLVAAVSIWTAGGVLLLPRPAPGQVNLPEGFEVVEIERWELGIKFPRINNCGQIVVTRGLEGDLREVFLYDNGSFVRVTHNSRPNRSNSLPDINDQGTIVWSRYDRGSYDLERIFVYHNGRVSRVGRGYRARINNQGHMTWQRFRIDEGCKIRWNIMFYDGDSITRIFRSQLTDQSPEINDLDQITWMHTDFCQNPWVGDIRVYSDGEITVLESKQLQVQAPKINNVPQVAWQARGAVEIWEKGEIKELVPSHGSVPNLNNLGDLYFAWWDLDRAVWQPWLYRVSDGEPAFHRLAEDDFFHGRGDVNDWGEVAWRFHDGRSAAGGLRFLRRIRTGDSEFDRDIDLADYAVFADCMTGPGRVDRLCDCRFLDIDHDGDVDLGDFALFQNAFTGP